MNAQAFHDKQMVRPSHITNMDNSVMSNNYMAQSFNMSQSIVHQQDSAILDLSKFNQSGVMVDENDENRSRVLDYYVQGEETPVIQDEIDQLAAFDMHVQERESHQVQVADDINLNTPA